MLVIRDGNDEIYFSVETDSSGRSVIPERLVYDGYTFEFQSWDSKIYHFIFSNKISPSTSKSIYWIVWGYWYDVLFLILGAILLVAGGILLLRKQGIFQRVLKQTKTSQDLTKKEENHEAVRIRCIKCGTVNSGKAKFCNECGNSLLPCAPDSGQKQNISTNPT